MAGDRNNVIFEMWRARERRSYFLMSSSGAGIGYALATVSPNIGATDKLVVVLALVLWSGSFIFGLRVLQLHRQEMNLSQEALKFIGTVPPEAISVAKGVVEGSAQELGPKIHFSHQAQVSLLLVGALTFAVIRLDVLSSMIELAIQ